MAVGVVKEARDKPRKALIYAALGYGLLEAFERNPNEDTLICRLRHWNNEMALIPQTLRNAESEEYLKNLEQAVNQHRIRTLSLGCFTILWLDKYDSDDCTFPAICEYTRVRYWNLPQHIVDIGFWNEFWRLRMKMHNYDVNYL